MSQRPWFGWASCAAPFLCALPGLIPLPRPDLIVRVLIGVAIGSAVGMICAAASIARRERPWWVWLLGLSLNAYPFIFFLLGLSVLLGITSIHL